MDHFRRTQISRLEALGVLALAPDSWKESNGRDSYHKGVIGMITFHGTTEEDLHHHTTIAHYQQPSSTSSSSSSSTGFTGATGSTGSRVSSEKDHIPSPYPKPAKPHSIETHITHTQPTGPAPRALFPYDEPLPEILGEKTALTAFGTRYVTPKAPGGKGSGGSGGSDKG